MGTSNIQGGGCCQPESQKGKSQSRVHSQTIDGQLEREIVFVDMSLRFGDFFVTVADPSLY